MPGHMSDEFLANRKRALEDEFFRKEEAKKLARMRKKIAQKETRDALKAASGIADEPILDRLAELGLTAETVAALALAPLVHVAWADGKVQKDEREAILEAAHAKGIDKKSPAYELLAEWLGPGEPPRLYETWAGYIRALGEKLTDDQARKLQTQIVGFARAIAGSSGGLLGVGKISGAEQVALAEIEQAFERK